MASALGFVVEAHLAKTDAALLPAIIAGQGAFGLVYAANRAGRRVPTWLPLVFWPAQAAAILLKGRPGPVLALLTVVSLSIADRDTRWLRGLRPLAGASVTALIVAPWLIAVESATGGQFVSGSLLRDLLPKLVGAQESHGAPPGYYLGLANVSFWPGSLFIVPALLWRWRQRHDAATRFLLALLVPAWICFELVPTKLPHYVLPLYPALALLAGGALAERFAKRLAGPARFVDRAVGVLWGVVTIVLGAAFLILPLWSGATVSPMAMVVVPVMLGLACVLIFRDPPPMRTARLVAAISAAFVVPAALWVAPVLDYLWPSR